MKNSKKSNFGKKINICLFLEIIFENCQKAFGEFPEMFPQQTVVNGCGFLRIRRKKHFYHIFVLINVYFGVVQFQTNLIFLKKMREEINLKTGLSVFGCSFFRSPQIHFPNER